jgi:hypothetical protein
MFHQTPGVSWNRGDEMQVTRIILVLGLVLCVPDSSFAAAKKKPAVKQSVRAKKVRAKKPGLKRKKPLVQQLRELPRKKPSEKIEKPAVERAADPVLKKKVEDTRWTDPIVLRDTLFLSASARHARTDPAPIREQKSSPR